MSSSSAVAMSADPIHSRPPSASASSSSTPPPPRSVPPCACCGHARPDVVVSGCPSGCAYHARCLDLAALIRAQGNTTSHGKSVAVHRCPGCGGSCNGLAMLPLDFREMDAAQKGTSSGGRDRSAPSSSSGAASSGGAAAPPSSGGNKRLHDQLLTSGAERDGSYYDPNVHRVGKWSPEEIAFRDELIPHFVEGNLPLNNGLKLIDFLSRMLKSKPSRLTKKMKHARLSTRHFHTDIGFIPDRNKAAYLSALEDSFVNSIGDAVERTEIRFHMGREWRDHIAERLTYMRIGFDASEWLRSVDVMERRIALATNRNRMVRRRFMMGKAMEKDMSTPTHGVFIEQTPHDAAPHHDEVDFELLASALETSDGDDGDLLGVYADMSAANPGESPGVRPRDADDGGMDVDPSPAAGSGDPLNRSRRGSSADAETAFRSHVLPSVVSSSEPNFKLAAPFLSKITAYVEHNRIPFECADIWVPSEGCPSSSSSGGEATGNPPAATRGSGCERSAPGVTGRLCFAGSAVVNVQVANDDDVLLSPAASSSSSSSQAGGSAGGNSKRVVPLTGDEVYNLSLFGNYSEKFSFLPGCGLPGRVYESGVPAWEQFVANAPAHLFERRGGAVQFGIKTALGMPVASPTVGRVVVVLYSRHNRIKDDGLVAQMMGDFRGYSPTPQWKLVVEVTSPGAAQQGGQQGQQQQQQQQVQAPQQRQKAPAAFAALAESNAASQAAEAKGDEESRAKVRTIISLLGENMPSDPTTPLGSQIDNIMGLRFVLLKSARTPHEEQLVDSILTLHDSYVEAGRSRPEITMMLARDWQFHSVQQPPPSHAPPPAVCQQPVSGLLAAQHHHQHQQLMGHAPLGLHSMNHAAPSHQPMVSAMSKGSLPSMMGGSIPALQHLSIQSGGAVRRTSGSGFGGAVSAFNALSHQHHQQQQEAVVHLEHTHHGAPTPSVPIPVGGNPPPPPRPSSFPPAAASVLGSSYPGRARGGALGASLMERNYSDRSGGGAAATSGGSPPGPEPLAGGGGGADTLMERDYSETNFASPSPETHGGAGRTERIPEPRSAEDGPSAARAEVPSAAKVEDDETVDAEG